MKVISQCKVIGLFNYDRIKRNIKKKYAQRQNLGQTNGKIHLIKIFFFLEFVKVNVSKHLEGEASQHLPVLLLVIYTFIRNIY